MKNQKQRLAQKLGSAFLLGGTCGFGQGQFLRLDGRLIPHVSLHKQGMVDIISLLNHFSMPDRQEMEYIPVELEARMERSRGLRFILERLLLRLLRHSCVCSLCQRLRSAAGEKVIEF